MKSIDDKLIQDKLGLGKILILSEGHGLSVDQIKFDARADDVKELEWSGLDSDVDTFILKSIYGAILHIDGVYSNNLSVYYVKGENALSTFVRLKTSKVLGSISLDSSSVKKLLNAHKTKSAINSAKESLIISRDSHIDASEILSKQKKSNELEKLTVLIEKIVEGYGENEIKEEMRIIEEIMKDSW